MVKKKEEQILWESRYDENHNLLYTVTSDTHRTEYQLHDRDGKVIDKAVTPYHFFVAPKEK